MFGLWYVFFGLIGLSIISIIIYVCIRNTRARIEVETFFIAISVVCGIIGSIMFLLAWLLPADRQSKFNKYRKQQPTYQLYASFIQDDNFYTIDNIDIIADYKNQIDKYNEWLFDARSSQESLGCFSSYYKLDLSEFEYINYRTKN